MSSEVCQAPSQRGVPGARRSDLILGLPPLKASTRTAESKLSPETQRDRAECASPKTTIVTRLQHQAL